MMEHLVEAQPVRRFLATVERDNAKSVIMLERLGFVRAGLQESGITNFRERNSYSPPR